ncbi:porin [Burkholderia diffusa]|uniref:porin n=1 Tax=Burkholderia diffusa TaxID=488732 RepID=UPI000751C87B|nr:porin [Burkholderia diffusa]KWF87035.1 porin [Burkholderia diffusa]
MKKTIASLAALIAMISAANVAHAQSTVTLYGLIDEGLDFTNNVGGHHQFVMSSGDVQGSRWGLRGSEDLGGGLKAVFTLESGLNLNNGKLGEEGQMFGRQAYVGLSSATVGTLTMGRQYDSLVEYLAGLTVNGSWGGGVFAHPYDNDNTSNTFRLNNAVQFNSATFGGFSFGATYAFSNSSNFGLNRAESFGAQYANGPLTAAAAYLNVDNPNSGAAGAVAIGPNGGPDGSWTAQRHRIWGAGINYAIGATTLGFVYTHTDIKAPSATQYANLAASPTLGAASTVKFDNFELNAKYQVNDAFMVGGMYTFTDAKFEGATGSAKPKYHQFGLMADYNLSKRTDVYVQGGYVKVSGAEAAAGTGLEVAMSPDAYGPSSTSSQFVGRVGIRHRF